jgi:hypothetical protein
MQNVVEERINICRLAEGIGKTAEEGEEEEEEEREELPFQRSYIYLCKN